MLAVLGLLYSVQSWLVAAHMGGCGMWDLNSLDRDQTLASSNGSMKS